MLYSRINLKRVSIRHSRLYHLMPIGVGTPYVESITGYAVRLAEAHKLSTGVLFRWEISPEIGKSYLDKMQNPNYKFNSISSSTYAIPVNGYGTMAKDWVRSLESLTRSDRLKFLTMITWEHVISMRSLLRPIRAWCPTCYHEWHTGGRVIYEPLMWKLSVVLICPIHYKRFRTSCHDCKRQLQVLSASARSGRCDHCGAWLGIPPRRQLDEKEELDEKELRFQTWVGSMIGELLAKAPTLQVQASEGAVSRALSSYISRSSVSRSGMARHLNMSPHLLNQWTTGISKPSAVHLLKFCWSIDVPPLQFIMSSVKPEQSESKGLTPEPIVLPVRKVSSTYRGTRGALRAALTENPPPSISEVARRVGRYADTLRRHFNKLYEALFQRHQDYVKEQRSKGVDEMRQTLCNALKEDPPPTIPELLARVPSMSLGRCKRKFPDLYKAVSARHATWLRDRLEQIRKSLEGALNEDPPVSMKSMARRLSWDKKSLYLHFPNLCYAIAARFTAYRTLRSQKREENFRAEVRRIALMLVSKGLYPSVVRVQQNLPKYKALTGDVVANDELRKIRAELGLKRHRLRELPLS